MSENYNKCDACNRKVDDNNHCIFCEEYDKSTYYDGIYIKTLTGKITTIRIWKKETVDSLRQKFYDREGFPIDYGNLLFDGKRLKLGTCLSDYNIKLHDTIYFITNTRGD